MTKKAGMTVMMMGYKLMAIDKASWETPTHVAAGWISRMPERTRYRTGEAPTGLVEEV